MVVINNSQEAKSLTIILKKYKEYYNQETKRWEIPSVVFKNITKEVWRVSKEVNKD